MPIRINFLAEQHAAEDLKRRDPVKRVAWITGALVGALVLWSAFLQARLMAANSAVKDVESRFAQIRAQYQLVRTNHIIVTEAESKLTALNQLAAERFLWAVPLHTLQYAVVNDVELTQIRGAQTYTLAEGTPAVTNSTGVVPGKPASARERIILQIEGRDYSANPVANIRLYQEALTNQAYFRTAFTNAELAGLSPVQTEPESSRPFVTFTIECKYPDRVR
jgi:hypothetical protein